MRLIALLAVGVAGALFTALPTARADDVGQLYRLVDTSAQRLQTADPVAAFKWVDGGSIEDAPRVRQVLDTVAADAQGRGVDETFVRQAFEDQIHATEGIEYIRFGQWKLDPTVAPTTAPDLSESRTAIDGFNRIMVGEMAARRDVLGGPDCAVALDEARVAVVATRQLDQLYADALHLATQTYCAS